MIEDSFARARYWCDDCGGGPAVLGDFVLGRSSFEDSVLDEAASINEIRELFEGERGQVVSDDETIDFDDENQG